MQPNVIIELVVLDVPPVGMKAHGLPVVDMNSNRAGQLVARIHETGVPRDPDRTYFVATDLRLPREIFREPAEVPPV